MTTVETSKVLINKNPQVSRWILTCNNYDSEIDYEEYFKQKNKRIKRMIVGFWRGSESGSRHLQGFVQFNRSIRYSVVRQMLPNAYWHPAHQSSRAIFEYYARLGDFFVIGNFQREENLTVSVRYKSSHTRDSIVVSTSEVTDFRKTNPPKRLRRDRSQSYGQ